ncbi:hypothetical protein [Paracraurococcus lichenis]|uniref:Uncharacterized protein n=1 Tax=Paracraurococcus lichenis TaxID=3064888 RepID=A0ABT9DVK1_9PROT|nr:hypothetical protein [Paracraurococcus sp. LOR1-02]MDO9707929.1 hypothetical protein [Paracraurococcus sp. LOR1-02]
MPDDTATLLRFPSRNQDRLRLALRELVAALDAQSKAVADFRGELRNLAGAMQGLEGSVKTYQGQLGGTLGALREAGENARKLERTAEGWLTATRT